ncbi:MAG: dTDP-4-dehydrorhamnose reductase [Phycisphaerae bacterium]|nr:dTDP-4-dehydrorhamnose reductase [Phycisphaerae bacterium]
MTVLVTGAGGQLASEIERTVPEGRRVVALSEIDLDIRNREAVRTAVHDIAPSAIVNAAAYTAVDKAESEQALAFAVNRDGAAHVAEAAAAIGAMLVHVSTDFVFDGAASSPYATDAAPNPLSVYGRSKYEGDCAVRAACPGAAIVRTAWVYAATGRNFVATMLRLMEQNESKKSTERGAVRVVSDQIGSPTSAHGLAECCWRLIDRRAAGLWHWTDAGVASWYDFACAIGEFGVLAGLLESPPAVEPIRTVDYPTPARRPAYGVLDKTSTWNLLGLKAPHWRLPLRIAIEEMARGKSTQT